MFFKFVGGSDEILSDIFEKAVVGGSVKFGSALEFNDPFEFKFRSIAPSKEIFDRWHEKYDPLRTPEQLKNAWESFSGSGASWNTSFQPRVNALSGFFVLCLAARWNSPLMWAHYTATHRGFAIRYKAEVINALRNSAEHVASGPVQYQGAIPDLRWFSAPPGDHLRPVLFTKSSDWSYEEEFRVIATGVHGASAIFRTIDPALVSGIILGARAPAALVEKALDLREERPDFSVEQVLSLPDSYEIVAHTVDRNTRVFSQFL